MFDLDRWDEIFSSLRRHKLRTFATAFGVFWGILMLVILLGAGQGLQNGVEGSMLLDATNSIWFITGQTTLPYKGMSPGKEVQLTEEDLRLVEKQVEGFEYMSPENWLSWNYSVFRGRKNGNFMVLGVDRDYFKIKIYQEYKAGRKLNLNDNIEVRKVCVIGDKVAEILFESDEDPIGEYIVIKDVSFRVVGVFHDDGNGGRFSERIYIPFSTFQATYNPTTSVRLFAVTTQEGVSGKALENEIIDLISQKHFIHPDDRQALWAHNQEDEHKKVQGLFLGIKSFIWLVGIGTLLAGIVGVSNIMIIVVKDRTREIGIRKALGATPWSIVSLILSEAIVVTSIAGYLGLVAGVALLEGLNFAMHTAGADVEYFSDPRLNFTAAISALLILVFAGALAGLVPALRASRIRPIEALRAE